VKEKRKQQKPGIAENDFDRLVSLTDKLRSGIDLLYYLLDNRKTDAFVAALISAESIDLEKQIRKQKRKTDILYKVYEVDASQNLYALLCQGTGVDGGYYFIQRLIEAIRERGGKDVYCSELEINNSRHSISEITLRLLDMYRRARNEKADGEIKYHALS